MDREPGKQSPVIVSIADNIHRLYFFSRYSFLKFFPRYELFSPPQTHVYERGKIKVKEGDLKELNDAVTLCRKGNRAAYRGVVETLSSRAVRYAYHFLGNYLDAEDAAQEAFIQAWRRLETLKDEHAFLQWFYRILANIAQRKGKGARYEEPLEKHEQTLEDSGSDPAALFETTERQELIKAALQKLPPHYRSVIVLRDIEGFPYSEIARILEIPEGTVKSRLSAARERLRSMLYDKEGRMIQCRAEMFRKN